MNELNAKYGLDIRKDAKHLRDKYIKKEERKEELVRVASPTEDDAESYSLNPIRYYP